jgi:DNA polymerase I
MVAWDDARFIAFDFETSGELPEYALQPWRVAQGTAWATSLVWCQKDPDTMRIEGGLAPSVKTMRAMLEHAIAEKRTICGWNTIFDIQWLLAYGLEDLVFQAKWLDGMLLWRHFFIEPEYDTDKGKKKSYGLKSCVAEVLPRFAGYEEDVDFHSDDPEELRRLHEYNVRDTMFTLRLTRHWYRKLAEEPQRLKAALIEADCLPLVAKANLDGMVVDTLAAKELSAKLDNDAATALEKLAPFGVTEKVVRSPTQLATLMFDIWKLPVLKENTGKKTGKVSRATDKEVLHELAFVDERAKTLREYREALNNKTKFAAAPLASVDYNGDGRTRPQAIVFGTYSGRLTYASKQGRNKDERQTGFALHQEKRGKEFRSIIQAPEGYTIVEFDASGQEFRWMAIASGDETMLQLCLPGEDPHSYMGAQIRNKNYKDLMRLVQEEDKDAKDGRQLGKVANLSLQYRTSAPKLRSVARVQYNLPMELPEAQMIHKTYQMTYRQVPLYWQKQISMTKRLGYVETLAGRRVQVVGNWAGSSAWSMGSTAINYRIQGTGADQKYLAISVLRPYLRRIGAYFGWDLHDGIYVYVPDAQVSRAAEEIPKILANLPYKKAWGFSPPIPLPWDCKIGGSWGALKEHKGK